MLLDNHLICCVYVTLSKSFKIESFSHLLSTVFIFNRPCLAVVVAVELIEETSQNVVQHGRLQARPVEGHLPEIQLERSENIRKEAVFSLVSKEFQGYRLKNR